MPSTKVSRCARARFGIRLRLGFHSRAHARFGFGLRIFDLCFYRVFLGLFDLCLVRIALVDDRLRQAVRAENNLRRARRRETSESFVDLLDAGRDVAEVVDVEALDAGVAVGHRRALGQPRELADPPGLVRPARADVPALLRDAIPQYGNYGAIQSVATILAQASDLDGAASLWVVREFARALGLIAPNGDTLSPPSAMRAPSAIQRGSQPAS